MNVKLPSMMFLGVVGFGIGMGTQNASASDLSRFLEHSRINIAVGNGPVYPATYGAQYPMAYGPQSFPQYGNQYGGYPPIPQTAVPLVPGYAQPIGGYGYGYGAPAPVPYWQGSGRYDCGHGYGHHHHEGQWR